MGGKLRRKPHAKRPPTGRLLDDGWVFQFRQTVDFPQGEALLPRRVRFLQPFDRDNFAGLHVFRLQNRAKRPVTKFTQHPVPLHLKSATHRSLRPCCEGIG
jgi:hypothetical protein